MGCITIEKLNKAYANRRKMPRSTPNPAPSKRLPKSKPGCFSCRATSVVNTPETASTPTNTSAQDTTDNRMRGRDRCAKIRCQVQPESA